MALSLEARTRWQGLTAVVAVTLALCGCDRDQGPAPLISRLDPESVTSSELKTIEIHGQNFWVRLKGRFDDPSGSSLRGGYQVGLQRQDSADPGRTIPGERRSELLIAFVQPEGLSPGLYDVTLVDPFGRKVSAPTPLRVEADDCTTPGFCNDGQPCTLDTCAMDGGCVHALDPGNCLVDGRCQSADARAPNDDCMRCQPQLSTLSWSPAPDATPCEDGDRCTQGETCRQGVCGSPTTATSCDAGGCMEASCRPADGTCGAPTPSAPGTACEDGDACTAGLVCDGQGGCGNPVSCNSAPVCFANAGTCSAAGGCVYAPSSQGASCEDGRACTINACDGDGGCSVTAICPTTPGQCFSGQCAANGDCEYLVRLAASCDDQDPCTEGDSCESDGGCSGAPVVCAARPCQFTAGCAGGGCLYTDAPPGSACDDGDPCTLNSCGPSGNCLIIGATCATNLPPIACLTVSPVAGPLGTVVTASANCSADTEDPLARLEARFDFGDGLGFGVFNASKVASRAFTDAGFFTVTTEVRDDGGLTAFDSRYVSIHSPALGVMVTTPVDEENPSASPGSPGGVGFSLREAMLYVNLQAQPITIRFDGGMNIVLTNQSLPLMVSPGTTITGPLGPDGRPQVSVDFSAIIGITACFQLDTVGVKVIGLELRGCGGHPASMKANDTQVASCVMRGSGQVGSKCASMSGGLFGPGNDVSGYTDGLQIKGPGCTAFGNHFHENAVAIVAADVNARILKNVIYDGGLGVEVSNNPGPTILFNTFHRLSGSAISSNASTPLTARNNLFSSGGACPLAGSGAWGLLSPNGFFQNATTGAGCQVPNPLDAGNVFSDPRYVNAAGADFRLRPQSPAINAGVPLAGIDVNGPAAGDYTGPNPDLGAFESPYVNDAGP